MKSLQHPREILIIGNGGRENALAWTIIKNKGVQKVYVAPGNGGTESINGCHRLNISADNKKAIIEQCRSLHIDLIIIGPEAPLADGLANVLRDAGLIVFGPCSEGAKLEASKSWAKALMQENGIPTAKYWAPDSEKEAIQIVDNFQKPLVVKVDGLAAGKGVTVCNSIEETKTAIKDIYQGKFSSKNSKLILEEKLSGPEISIFALCDGNEIIVLPAAQDHKRLLEGDRGPNTGGMGAYVPAPLIDEEQLKVIKDTILYPTLKGLKNKNIDYRGVMYAGLMLTPSGPSVIEFNCRFGDPECQALMPLMGDEFINILYSCATGSLSKAPTLQIKELCSACIILAAKGYPHSPSKGDKININLKKDYSYQVFHSGTKVNEKKELVTSGGRVLSIVAQSDNFENAFNLAYNIINKVNFEGMIYRKDIGYQVRKINNNN